MVNVYSKYVAVLTKSDTIFDLWSLIAQMPKNSSDGTYHMVADQILIKLIHILAQNASDEDMEIANKIIKIYMNIEKTY